MATRVFTKMDAAIDGVTNLTALQQSHSADAMSNASLLVSAMHVQAYSADIFKKEDAQDEIPDILAESAYKESNWHCKYVAWRKKLENSDKTPYQLQWQLLDILHARLMQEYDDEHNTNSSKLVQGIGAGTFIQARAWLARFW